ncbi:MAG TPA: hypothetical protein VGH86_10655 [Phenylobacterium sp.]|jgi:hypothetical protein
MMSSSHPSPAPRKSREVWSPAMRRYMRRMWPTMAVYAVVLVGVIRLFDTDPPTGPLKYAAAVAPAIPLLVNFWFYGRYIVEEDDEFRRLQIVLTMLIGLAVVLAVTTVWGFLEVLAGAPHIPVYFVAVVYVVAQGLSAPLVAWRYR